MGEKKQYTTKQTLPLINMNNTMFQQRFTDSSQKARQKAPTRNCHGLGRNRRASP